MKKTKTFLLSSITLLTTGILMACSSQETISQTTSQSSVTATNSNQVSNSQNSSSSFDWTSLPTTEVALTDAGLTITEAGTYILSGETTDGVIVESQGNVRLILAGVTISSQDNAALYIAAAENTVIELEEGTTNTIRDSANHSDQSIEGALYSKDDLYLTGKGSLMVQGVYQDAIVSNDDLIIEDGQIQVEAQDDGIRGKDSLQISGGSLDITAVGDGLKATNDEDLTKGYTHITGGHITVQAGDDGIKAESSLVIDGGDITVTTSTEALEGSHVTINGGQLDLYASDDGINAASTATSDIFVKITGGDIKLEVGSGDTDAIDSNGDIYMSGGNLDITAQFAFDFDGQAEYTGGTIVVNGQTRSEIVADGPGGGGFGGGGRPPGR